MVAFIIGLELPEKLSVKRKRRVKRSVEAKSIKIIKRAILFYYKL